MNHPSSRAGIHLFTGTIRIFLAEALILPTGFITAVFLARSLGPVGYGLFALVSRLIVWIEWTSISGLSATTIKLIGGSSDWRPISAPAMKLHFITGICTAALLWLFASPLSHLFNEPVMASYIRFFALEIPILSISGACSNILIGTGRFKEKARISTARWIARLILIIFFVEMGLSVNGAILGSIGASIVELTIGWLYARPILFYKAKIPIRRLLGFGAPLFMSELCQRIFRLDLFALKALGGTAAQAGFYGAAMNLSIPPMMLSKSFAPPLLSTLSILFGTGDHHRAEEISVTALRSIICVIPFAAMVAGASREIVVFIYGDRYNSAGPLLSLLIFAAIGLLALNISKAIITAQGKPVWTLILTGPMVPLAFIGHLILIPRMGGVGAATVTTLVACLTAVMSLYIVNRLWKVFLPFQSMVKGLLCSVIAFYIAEMWAVSGPMLIVKLLVITFIILAFYRLTGEITSREMDFVRSLLSPRKTETPRS